MQRPILALTVFAALVAGAVAADDPAKQPLDPKRPTVAKPPTGQATVVAPEPTGYDVAIVALSSTGPEGNPANALKVTFENQGTMSLYHDLKLEIRANGQVVSTPTLHLMIPPGGSWTWTNMVVSESNLFPWGTEAWAKIDTQNVLREDNETNNTLSRRLDKMDLVRRPAHIPRP